MVRRVALLALLGCFSVNPRAASADGPPLPYIDRGVCPFECCTYREWTVNADTPVRARRDPKAPVVFTAKSGESVHGLTGVVVTLEPGRVLVLEDTQIGGEDDGMPVRKDTVVYSLHSLGEGYSLLWHEGRNVSDFVQSVEAFKMGTYHKRPLRPETDPKTVWWVLIENASGDVGWSDHPENFGNIDACG
jgi:hypothetical protein